MSHHPSLSSWFTPWSFLDPFSTVSPVDILREEVWNLLMKATVLPGLCCVRAFQKWRLSHGGATSLRGWGPWHGILVGWPYDILRGEKDYSKL